MIKKSGDKDTGIFVRLSSTLKIIIKKIILIIITVFLSSAAYGYTSCTQSSGGYTARDCCSNSCAPGTICSVGNYRTGTDYHWSCCDDNTDGETNYPHEVPCSPAPFNLDINATYGGYEKDTNWDHCYMRNPVTICTWHCDDTNTGIPCSEPDPATTQLCTDGQTRPCTYTGPAGTENVGICKAGTQTCVNGQWGACQREVLPTAEVCGNNIDENCDGNVNEGCETCSNNNCGDSTCNKTNMGSSANFGSGNLYHDQTLFRTTTLGFTLSYNSIDLYSGALGKGWTHNYNLLLFSNPSDNSIGLKQGDGRVVYFRLNQGVYYPEVNSGETSYITYNSSAYTLTEKDGTTYNFNTQGKLTSIKDRNNNTTTLTYSGDALTTVTDPSGRTIYITTGNGKITSLTTPDNKIYRLTYIGDNLTSVSDPEMNTWQYTYNPNGQMLTKTDPQGYTTTYTYDTNNKVISSQDPEGKTKAIIYDPINQTAQATEKDGGIWTYRYDSLLNVTTQKTDPKGNITTYTYDTSKNLISTKEPDGSTTSYAYDAYGNMTSITDPLGNTTSYTYNTLGQITSITDSENKVTTYAYDTKGNLLSTTDTSGAITQYQYDSKGNVISITNPNSQRTTFSYDQFNNMTSVTDSTGATTTFTYDSVGNITSQTDPNGNITRFEYNSLNQLIKITDPQNNITTYTYDKNGNKTSETDANGKATYYEYNYRNQLTKVTDSLGGITTYTYGGTGCSSCGGGGDKLTSITDSKGRVISYSYDSIGRLIRIIDPINGTISYTYDSRGRLTSVADPNGNITTYEYDTLGRVIKTNSPDTGTTTYTYNSIGNILTKTDANGITVQYAYDSLNRLTNIQFPDQTQNTTYTYDNCTNGKGRLCYMTDPSGTTAYEYDSPGRITKETKTILGIAYITTYEYDKTGSLTTITYPSGRKVNYTYNSAYRPTGVTQQIHKAKTSLATNILYDKAQNMLSMTLGNKITQQWAYDAKNRINTITVPAIFALNYTYDPIGNITSIIDHQNPANIKTYTYDSLDRLINAAGPWGNLNWTYDANGNRLSQSNTEITNYTYQANKLTNITTNNHVNQYQYDNNGNTISNGKLNFIYNQNNSLMKAVADGKIIGEYTYNGKGQRIIKKTKSNDEGGDDDGEYDHHIVFHYDLAGRLIEETKANGKLIADYIYLNGNPLAMIRKQHHQEETFYYHNDHLGTPKVMTDKLKKIVWNTEFDPFGNEIKHNHGRHGKYIRKVKNNIRFPGQYFDKETGLHQNWFRDYDPKTGAYPQGDPIGIVEGTNHLFVYAKSNPLRFTDSSGLTAAAIPLIEACLANPRACGGAILAGGAAMFTAIKNIVQEIPRLCRDDDSPCPPCKPYPAGTIGYIGPHYEEHFPCGNPHMNLFIINQDSKTCKCYWNKNNPDCASGTNPSPGWVNCNAGFPQLSP